MEEIELILKLWLKIMEKKPNIEIDELEKEWLEKSRGGKIEKNM